jgi:F0F1-type ATP synthase delta subunit
MSNVEEEMEKRIIKKVQELDATLKQEFGDEPSVDQKIDALFTLVAGVMVGIEMRDELMMANSTEGKLDRLKKMLAELKKPT